MKNAHSALRRDPAGHTRIPLLYLMDTDRLPFAGKNGQMTLDSELISISDFSRLSGIKRKNLIFYDECGLLPPARVGSNGYRYYSSDQLSTVYIIRAFREMGFALKDIKDILRDRHPEHILELFREQEETLAGEIARLQDSLGMMRVYQHMLKAARLVDEDRIELVEKEGEPVFFGPAIDYFEGMNHYDTVAAFFEIAGDHGIQVGYPLCAEVAKENFLAGDWTRPRRLYCKMTVSNGVKAAGLYAVGYGRGGSLLSQPMLNYIKANRLEVAGDAYEEKLVDELSTEDEENFLIRLEVRVEKK